MYFHLSIMEMENSYILAFEVLYQCNERVINLHGGHEGFRRERKITSLSGRIAIIPPNTFLQGFGRKASSKRLLESTTLQFCITFENVNLFLMLLKTVIFKRL